MDSSLGVNRMWTKRNDCAPKSECVDFYNICPKRVFLDFFPSSTILLSSLVFSFFTSTKNPLKSHYKNISLPWAIAFFLLKHLFCLSHRKTHWIMSVDNVGLKICILGTSNSMVTLIFFPWCKLKWSRNELNNQSQILQGLGRLHGPWCKQPLSVGV